HACRLLCDVPRKPPHLFSYSAYVRHCFYVKSTPATRHRLGGGEVCPPKSGDFAQLFERLQRFRGRETSGVRKLFGFFEVSDSWACNQSKTHQGHPRSS